MQLKHSLPDWCYLKQGMDPAEYYRRIKAAGCEAVEMVTSAHRPLARSAGLQILNQPGPGMQQGLNNPANHATLLPEIGKAMAAAAADKIPHLIIFSGNRYGPSDAEGLSVCTEAVRRLVPAAEKTGVTLIFEMLNGFDHAGYQADSSRYGFDLVRAVGSPRVKVLYDIYHMHRMGENLKNDLLQNLDIIAHLHTAGSPKRDFPGLEQAIDYGALVPAVHKAGYRGFWGHEFIPAGDPAAEAIKAIELFERFMSRR